MGVRSCWRLREPNCAIRLSPGEIEASKALAACMLLCRCDIIGYFRANIAMILHSIVCHHILYPKNK